MQASISPIQAKKPSSCEYFMRGALVLSEFTLYYKQKTYKVLYAL